MKLDDTSGNPEIKMLHRNVTTFGEEFWTLSVDLNGSYSFNPSGGLSGVGLGMNTNANLGLGRFSFATSAAAASTFTPASYTGYMFYNTNIGDICYCNTVAAVTAWRRMSTGATW